MFPHMYIKIVLSEIYIIYQCYSKLTHRFILCLMQVEKHKYVYFNIIYNNNKYFTNYKSIIKDFYILYLLKFQCLQKCENYISVKTHILKNIFFTLF